MKARQALLFMKMKLSNVEMAAASKLSNVEMAAASKLSVAKEALSAVELARSASELAAAQNISALKEALFIQQKREEETMRLLETAMTRDAAMNPRSVIEYVELFVMSQNSSYFKFKDRRKKWEAFLLDETTNGPAIMQCLKKNVPSWSSPSKAADQLSSMYSYTSEGVHVTSHEIADNPNLEIRITEGPSLLLQGAKAMLCIGDTLGLAVKLKKRG